MSALRLDLSMDGTAALFGMGYIIGLRYAAVIASGSLFAYFVLTPLIFHFGSQVPDFVYAGHHFQGYGLRRHLRRVRQTDRHRRHRRLGHHRHHSHGQDRPRLDRAWLQGTERGGAAVAAPRTQTDMAPRSVLLIQFGSTVLMAILFFVVGMTRPRPDAPFRWARAYGSRRSAQ